MRSRGGYRAWQAVAAGAALGVALPAIAPAQGGQASLPTVEVVATKTPEAPHDVPASIEVISGSDLRARGATTLRDALSLAAGVAIAPGGDGGPASAVPEFWGLREFDAFLLVVDNVPWGGAFNPALATLNLQDVERIEILRGPAPVTYGATSFVGVIHVVHKAAAEQARHVQAYGGTFGTGGAAIDFALPPMGSRTSRLSASIDKQGFRDDRTGVTRGDVIWRASGGDDAMRHWATFNLNLVRQDPASPHPREGATLSTQVPVDANHNPAGAYLDETRFALALGFDRKVMNTATWTTTGSFTHSGQRIFRGFLIDVSANDSASGIRENIDINDLYVDSHLAWPAGSQVKFLLGGDVLAAKGDAKGADFDYVAPLSGGSGTVVAEPSPLDLEIDNERMFWGGYGSMEWRPTVQFTLNTGLRMNYTSEKVGDGEDATNSRLSYNVGALYSLWDSGADHVRVFANYRDTFKPAAFDFGLDEAESDTMPPLKPETSKSYEGGVKVRTLDGRVDVEASYFHMDFENMVTSSIVGGQPELQNIGKTRFQGFELATDVRLTNDLTARATYSSHDGKFVDYVQDFGGVNTQLAGNRFEMSARQLYSLGITCAPETGWNATASLNYTGDRYMNKRNTALAPAFTTYDAGLGYRMTDWEVRVDGRNLGDARDAVAESEFGDSQFYLMPARSVLLRVIMKY